MLRDDGGPRLRGLLIDFDHAAYQKDNDLQYSERFASGHNYDDNDKLTPARKRPPTGNAPHGSDDSEYQADERKAEPGTALEDVQVTMEQTICVVSLSFLWGY
jgi:hypothetical protein